VAVVLGRVDSSLLVLALNLALEKADGEWSALLASLLAGNRLLTETATRPYRTVLLPVSPPFRERAPNTVAFLDGLRQLKATHRCATAMAV
jgi:hypothetical protein